MGIRGISTTGPRERILLIGGWGVGKSTAAVEIAKQVGRTFVIDTTFEADRNFGSVAVDTRHVEDWDEYMDAVRDVRCSAGTEDWLVIDRVDPVWDMAQAGFSEKAFGKQIEDWFVEYKAEQKTGHPFAGEYGINWAIIKRMYGAFMTEVMRFPGHVIVTAKTELLQQPNRDGTGGDSAELRSMLGKFGVRPAGEKNLGFMFHTVLWLQEVRQGIWTYTTIRDRNREQVAGKEMKNFVTSYLIPIAGWRLSGGPEASRRITSVE
jgi:hypothetical protein